MTKAFATLRTAGFRPPSTWTGEDPTAVWIAALRGISDAELGAAVSAYTTTSTDPWWPTIGQLRAHALAYRGQVARPQLEDRGERELIACFDAAVEAGGGRREAFERAVWVLCGHDPETLEQTHAPDDYAETTRRLRALTPGW